VEPPGLLGRALSGGGTAIQGGIYCSYDAFQRRDVRCELALPGGCSVYALDGVGDVTPLDGADAAAWAGVRVSGALRALRASQACAARAVAVRCLDPPAGLGSPAEEAALHAAAVALRGALDAAAAATALAGRGPGVLPEGSRHWARAPAEDVLLATLAARLLGARRPTAAVALLRSAAEAQRAAHPDPPPPPPGTTNPPPPRGSPPPLPAAEATLARALASTGDVSGARGALAAALERRPGDASLRLCAAEVELRAGGDGAAAVTAATEAARRAPGARASWLLLASALAASGRYGDALVALNCAPHVGITEEEAADPWAAWFPSGEPPAASRRTQPARAPLDAAAEAEARAWDEAALPGRASLAALPAMLLLPPPDCLPYATGVTPPPVPLPPAAAAAAAAYSPLVDMVAALGWEGFLELRGGVFVMAAPHEDEDADDDEGGADADAAEDDGSEERSPSPRKAAAVAGAPRAGTRDAGVRAAGAPPTGAPLEQRTPQRAPAEAEANASPAGADADVAPATADDGSATIAPSTLSRGEAEVGRDRRALQARSPLAPQRLCAEWLDALIGALYADVAEYTAWRAAEAAEARDARRAARAAGTPPEGDDEETAARDEASAADDASTDRDAALGTAGDWARRGALCERLKRPDDAERAYRVCVHLGCHTGAWRALARIYAAWGWAGEALTAAAQLAAAGQGVSSPVRALVAQLGLQAARDAQEALGHAPEAVNDAFHDVVRWKSDGWDK